MEHITFEKANEIAQTYFKLLIERYKQQGYRVEIIGDENEKECEHPSFYLRFTNSDNDCKLYKIIPYN